MSRAILRDSVALGLCLLVMWVWSVTSDKAGT
jgi:hypothetical protein